MSPGIGGAGGIAGDNAFCYLVAGIKPGRLSYYKFRCHMISYGFHMSSCESVVEAVRYLFGLSPFTQQHTAQIGLPKLTQALRLQVERNALLLRSYGLQATRPSAFPHGLGQNRTLK